MLELRWLIISLSIFALTMAYAIYSFFRKAKRRSAFKAFYIVFGGIFLASMTAFVPLYLPVFDGDAASYLTVALSSAHNAIRLYIVDCDMSFVLEQTAGLDVVVRSIYRIYINLLMVVSPILTVSAVLTFFANILTALRYFTHFFKNAYIFTELNEKSIALASSLKEKDPAASLIFTDVYATDDESSHELIEKAKELKSLLFKQDVTSVNFRFHSKKRKLYFFIIGKNTSENLNQVVELSSPYRRRGRRGVGMPVIGYDYPRGDTRIYVFSAGIGTEQNLSATHPKYLKIRRVNETQSMVYNLLNEHGMDIFDSAKETGNTVFNKATGENDPERKISALVVGMGLHGTEMVKALAWFGQMHPYTLEINAVDKDPGIAGLFHSMCPDLFDCNPPDLSEKEKRGEWRYHNGDHTTPGEAHYTISLYGGVDTRLASFDEMIKRFRDTTYVFVTLGSDDMNVVVATKLRILFRRMGISPIIHTIVYNTNSYEALKHGKTASGQSYDIVPFGNISTTFSANCILNSDLEAKALARHMKYVNHVIAEQGIEGEERKSMLAAEEETFWKYDYNYRSSIASVLHYEFKVRCGSPGSEKAPADRTEAEKVFHRYLEHQRWNAYVRSEGFVYAPVRDKLAKTHHLLVPFDDLPYSEQIKDDD
ncbi:MAG: hypothetical protein E7644_03580 [Ruminococcaceae bacterium]|nr:hypothetical protein [Oscillospiraceae bacterium]